MTVATTASFHDLQAPNAILNVQGGTLNMAGPSSLSYVAGLSQYGGTITGAGELRVSSAFNVGGYARMSGGGAIVVESGVVGTMGDATVDGFTLRNDGSLLQSGTATLSGKNGAVLDNRGTYTMNAARCMGCSYDVGILWYPSGDEQPVIRNSGTFQRTAGASAGVVSFGMDNDGVVALQASPIQFTRGATGETSTGSWSGVMGGNVTFAGPVTLGSATHLDGLITITSGPVSAASIQGASANLTVQGGTLELTGAASVSYLNGLSQPGGAVSVAGQLRVAASYGLGQSGRVTGGGSVIVESGASGTVGGGTLDDVTLRNDGSLLQSGNVSLSGKNGAVLDNRGTYTFNADRCAGCSYEPGIVWTPSGDAQPQVLNSGTFRRTSGVVSATVSWGIDNDGAVEIGGSSPVRFSRGASGQTSTGSWAGASGGVVMFTGPLTLGSAAIDGAVTVGDVIGSGASVTASDLQGDGAALKVQNGTLTLSDPAAVSHVASLSQAGGTVAGPGRVDVLSSLTLTQYATLNEGALVVMRSGATGSIANARLDGATLRNLGALTQEASGSQLDGRNGALLDNQGVYTLNAEDCSGCSYRSGLVLGGTGAPAILRNAGTLRKTSGSGTSNVYWPSENLGTIQELSTGHIKFYAAFGRTAPGREESYGSGNAAMPQMRRSCSGKPVNCATGNQYEMQADLAVGGRGLGLAVTRTYNSQLAAGQSSPGRFGYGWTSTYDAHLVVEPAQYRATVYQDDGSSVPFMLAADGTITAPAWVQAKLTKNTAGTYTYTLPDQSTYVFDAGGKLISLADRNGNATAMSYDGSARLATVTDPAGRTVTYTYSNDLVESATDPSGLTVRYGYTGGELTSVKYDGEDSPTWTFGYDGSHQLTSMTDARGHTTTTEYDGQRRAVSQTDALNRTRTWQYLADQTKVTEPDGSVTDLSFSNGQPTKIIRAEGTAAETTQRLVYDSSLRNTEVTDGNGHTTTFTYDGDGNRTSATDPTGRKLRWTYNSTHDVLTATTNSGIKTTIVRDPHGNPTSVSRTYVDSGVQRTQAVTMTYDSHGQLKSLKDPLQHETTFAYNSAGDQISKMLPNGQTTTASYDASSRVVSITAPRGTESGAAPSAHTTTVDRDKFGRPITVTDPLGRATHTTYDANGNITAITDSASRTSHATYDAEDQLIKETFGDGSTRQLTYDPMGRMATRTDGRGKVTTYHYDAAGNLSEIVDPLGRETTSGFDAGGNVTRRTDALGRTTTFAYDAADRLKTISYPAPDAFSVNYTYDADGRRASMTDATGQTTYSYDELGRLSSVRTATGQDLSYAYDLADHRTGITYPNGQTVTSDYDASGRLTAIGDWLGNTTEFSYDADGNLLRTDFPTSPSTSDTSTYDDAGELVDLKLGEAGSSSPQLGYQYGPGAEVSQIASSGLPGSGTQSYAYDNVGRLASENLQQVAYDLAGDITKLPSGDNLSYDDAGQLVSASTPSGVVSFDYNDVGQRVAQTPAGGTATTYSYSGAGRLASVAVPGTGTNTYAYDGDGLRIQATSGGSSTSFLWDPASGDLIGENATSYLYGPDGLPFEEIDSNDTPRFYHHDRLGSVRSVTDASGTRVASQSFDVYGNLVGSTGTRRIPFGFAGQYTDADTGLVYMRARYYDPQTGQFLTRDPLEQITEQAYQYAGNDPVNAVDPLGLFPISIGLPSRQEISDAAAGFGDRASFGLTRKIRQALGVDNVNYCSAAYAGGDHTGGILVTLAVPEGRLFGLGAKLATKGLGNIAAGVVRDKRVLGAAERWLGDGYREIAPGVFRSADNTRQFRMTPSDLGAKHPHVHFESVGPNGRDITENAHTYLR